MDTIRMKATISFAGVVSAEVGVLPVIDSTEKRVPFKTLHATCLTPIEQPKHCPACNVRVDKDDLISGYKAAGGYITVSEEEKKSVAAERSPVIEITKFVRSLPQGLDLHTQDGHWLVPEPGTSTDRYASLVETMAEMEVVGVAMTTLWGKQWPVIVGIEEGGLLLTKLWPARAVRHFDVDLPKIAADRKKLMKLVVGEWIGEISDDDLTAPAHSGLRELVDAKIAGTTFVVPEAPVPAVMVDDFDQALKNAYVAAREAKRPTPKKTKVKA
jgi:non-homologous end joining protein Ku